MGKIDPKQKLSKVTKRKPKSVAEAAKAMHDAAAKAGGTLTVSKGLGETAPRGQQSLPAPGMKASVFPDVNEAAEKLSLAIESAKSAGKARKRAHDVLVQKMIAHGETRYADRALGVVVEITTKQAAKLKKLDDGSKKRRGRSAQYA